MPEDMVELMLDMVSLFKETGNFRNVISEKLVEEYVSYETTI